MNIADFISIIGFMSCSFCFGYFLGFKKAGGFNK